LLQRSSTIEALCGGNIATESLNALHVQKMAGAMERHYGVAPAALEFYHVHSEVEGDHADRAVRILSQLTTTDETQARGRLAMRRAITARRICADGMLEAFVGSTR
jgi:pyrroloquinoline quinone (PQQ) biosynthesis protein C